MPIQGLNGAQRIRLQRQKLWEANGGQCYYCGVTTVLPPAPAPKGWRPMPNTATTEHLDHKLSPDRGKRAGEYRRVLACFRCNNQLGAAFLRNHPEEQKRRALLGKTRPKGVPRDQYFASAAPASIITEERTK